MSFPLHRIFIISKFTPLTLWGPAALTTIQPEFPGVFQAIAKDSKRPILHRIHR